MLAVLTLAQPAACYMSQTRPDLTAVLTPEERDGVLELMRRDLGASLRAMVPLRLPSCGLYWRKADGEASLTPPHDGTGRKVTGSHSDPTASAAINHLDPHYERVLDKVPVPYEEVIFAVDQLPTHQHTAVWHVYVERKTQVEAGIIQRVHEHTIGNYLDAALDALARRFYGERWL